MAYYDGNPNNKHQHNAKRYGPDSEWTDETPRGRREDRPARGGSRYGKAQRPQDGESRYGQRFGRPDRRDDRGPQRSQDSEYRGGERFGRPERRDDRSPRRAQDSEYRGGERFGRPDRRDDRGPRRSQSSEYRGRRSAPERLDRRFGPKPAEAPKPRYDDFEYHAPEQPARERPTPETERALPPENLLVGRNPIREALKAGRDLEKLLVQRGELTGSAREIVQQAKEARVPVQEVDKSRLDELSPHHQGLIAFASAYAYATVDDMLSLAEERNEAPFLIILDGVTDPQNLGAIIRSAECVGAHGVIVRERRGVGLTPAAVKASAGAVEHMKVARVNNLNQLLERLKRENIWTYAVTMDGEDYQKVDFDGGVALVIGSEGEGISRLTLEVCDVRVSLPMKGAIDSLNASVAAGVVMYRVLAARQS